MKILIFENEYPSVKGAFETANLLNFGGALDFTVCASSQQATFANIKEYSVIFVDIALATRSELDGFALIKKLESIDPSLLHRIIILTGNNKITDILTSKGINPDMLRIIIKPTNYEEITSNIQKIIPG